MILKTTMERYLFAVANAFKSELAVDSYSEHINDSEEWKSAYWRQVRIHDFWATAANKFENDLTFDERAIKKIRM